MRDSVRNANSGFIFQGCVCDPGEGCAPGGSEGSNPRITRTPTQVFSGFPEMRYLSRKVAQGSVGATGSASPPKLSVMLVMYASKVRSTWNGGPKTWISAPREMVMDTEAQAPKKHTSMVSETPTWMPPRKS